MASSAVIGLLRVLLSASSAEFDATMRRSADTAKAWSRDLKQVGQQATQVGMALTKTLTLPIAGVGISASKLAIEFESSFAGIRKTVDGVVDSSGNLTAAGKDMQQSMRDLAKTIPVNVNDLNRLGEAAGALGIPRDKIVDFATVMAKLGVSTNLTADQAADAIARIQNIFGAAGKDTERFASTLVALGNAGASTETDIVEMAKRIAGSGNTIGLTQAQVLAFASTLASVGINAEAGGSAISRAFLKINDAVQGGGPTLAEFARIAGVSSAQYKKAFQTDAAGATQMFIEGLGRLKGQGENINQTIQGTIGKSIILKDTLFRLSGAGALLNDQLKLADKAWKDNTALTKEAEQRFKTTESQMKLLGNRIGDVGITLGNALLPVINMTIGGLNKLIPVLDSIAKYFGALPAWVQMGIVAFAAIVAAAGPVIYVFGQIVLSASAVIGAFTKKGIATRALGVDYDVFGASADKASTKLGLLGKAASVAAAFFIGWEIGTLIADLTGLNTAIDRSVSKFEQLSAARAKSLGKNDDASILKSQIADIQQQMESLRKQGFGDSAEITQFNLRLQTLGSKLDVVNKAIKNGADANITYAKAIEFNATWEEKRIAGLTKSTESHDKNTGAVKGNTGATEELTAAQKKAAAAASAHAKELENIREKLNGTDAVQAFAKLKEALGGAIDVSKLTSAGLKEVQRSAEMASQGYLTLGKSVPPEVKRVYDETTRLLELMRQFDKAAFSMDTFVLEKLSSRNMSGVVPQVGGAAATGGNLAGTFAPVANGLAEAMGKAFQQLPQMLIGAFQGGGNVKGAVSGMGTLLGATLGKSIGAGFKALGKFGGPIGEAIGALAGPLIEKIFGMFGTAGRDTKLQMAAQTFGSVEEMQKRLVGLGQTEYDRLWKMFSDVGQNNKGQAVAAIDAITAALDKQKQKTDEVAKAEAAEAEAQKTRIDVISEKYSDALSKLDSEYKSLSDSVAAEAEEEFMGITETRERERMKQIEAERKALEDKKSAEIKSAEETYAATQEAARDAAKKTDEELRRIFDRGYDTVLRIRTQEYTGGSAIPPSSIPYGTSPGASGSWESRASRTAATRGSTVSVPAVFYLDQFGTQKLAEATAKVYVSG